MGITLTASDLASGAIKSVAKAFAGLDDSITHVQQHFAASLKNGFDSSSLKSSVGVLEALGTAASIAAAGVASLGAEFALANGAGKLELKLAEIANTTNLSGEDVAALRGRLLDLGTATATGPEKAVEAFRELASSTLTAQQKLAALDPTIELLEASFGRLSSSQAGGLVAKTLEAFPELADNATRAVDLLARAFRGGLKPEELAVAMNKAARGEKFLGSTLEEVLSTLGGAAGAGLSVERLSAQVLRGVEYTDKFAVAQARMRAALADTAITARAGAQAFESTWIGMKESISSAFEVLREEVGEPLLKAVKPFVDVFVGAVRTVGKWVHDLSPDTKALAARFAIFGSLGATVAGLGASLVALGPTIASVASALAPVVAIGAGVAAVSVAIGAAWEHDLGGVRDAVAKVGLAFSSLYHLFADGEISGALADQLLDPMNRDVFDFVESVSEGVAAIKSVWKSIQPAISEAWEVVKPILGEMKTRLNEDMGVFLDVGKAFVRSFEVVVGFFTGHLDHVVRGAYGAANALIDVVNTIIERTARIPAFSGLSMLKMSRFSDTEIDQAAGLAGAFSPANFGAAAGGESDGGGPPISSATRTALSTGAPGTTLSSQPLLSARIARAQASGDMAEVVAAIRELQAELQKSIEKSGDRPVRATLELDGQKIAEAQTRQARDRAAATGTIHEPYVGR
ncbi:MAG TPA: hypothetical protein VFF73_03025 [Planctomycetota bacterium]|nr:hypothetical protein [Planctomycetota bacterium]